MTNRDKLIEAMARAMHYDDSDRHWPEGSEWYFNLAKASLAVLETDHWIAPKEPTEEMLSATAAACMEYDGIGSDGFWWIMYRAMRDACLSETNK